MHSAVFCDEAVNEARCRTRDFALALLPAHDGGSMTTKKGTDLGPVKAGNLTEGGDWVAHDPGLSAECTPLSSAFCTDYYGSLVGMTPGDRLKFVRVKAGYGTAKAAAEAIGVPLFTYRQHENGLRKISRDAAVRYSRFFKVTVDWLLTSRNSGGPIVEIPIVAYIGAGAEVYPMETHPKGQGLDMVPPPPGVTDCVAAIIRGDSMFPLKDGWLVFWRKDCDGVPEECVGALCVVQVENGPMLIKDLRVGTRKGLFTLTSWNAPPRENVAVSWAAKIIDIRPS